jgi:hypothetical protein
MDINQIDKITSIVSHFTIIVAMLGLVIQVKQNWVSNKIAANDRFTACTAKYIKIQEILLSNADLDSLNTKIYGNRLQNTQDCKKNILGKETAVAGMMFQLMEDVWLTHDFDKDYDNDLYSGWHNLFKDWMCTEEIAEKWIVLKAHFSKGFIEHVDHMYVSSSPPSVHLT